MFHDVIYDVFSFPTQTNYLPGYLLVYWVYGYVFPGYWLFRSCEHHSFHVLYCPFYVPTHLVGSTNESTNLLIGSCLIVSSIPWVWHIVDTCHTIVIFQPVFSSLEYPPDICVTSDVPLVPAAASAAALITFSIALYRFCVVGWHGKSPCCFGYDARFYPGVQHGVGVLDCHG